MSGSALKLVALVVMAIDHIGEFFPGQTPLFLRWIGRLSAPIFVFCLCEGIRHTSDLKRFLGRLYLGSAVMGIANLVLNSVFVDAPVPVENHIFSALFLLGGCIVCVEQKRFSFLFFWQAASCGLYLVGNLFWPQLVPLVGNLMPGVLTAEGGPALLLLGLLFFFFGEDRRLLTMSFLLWGGLLFAAACVDLGLSGAVMDGYQWMEIGALPILLTYNGKRGRGMKSFFYLFYPLHIYFLFLLSLLTG